MNVRRCVSVLSLLAIAGTVMADPPATDGVLSEGEYPWIRWTQSVPTQFGDNVADNSCDNGAVGSPGAVTTGIEIKIPLAAIGNPTGDVRICAFLTPDGHDNVSNQVLGGIPAQRENLGEPRNVDFQGIAGNQYVTATAVAGTDPTIDGTRDGVYPAALAVQTCRTSFGDSNLGEVAAANGSELDNIHAVIRNGSLFVFIGGNMSSDFTKLEFFIDTGNLNGWNQLPTGLPDIDFNRLARLADDGSGNGLAFDDAFTADYYITFGCGGDPVTYYPSSADLNALTGGYLGSNTPGNGGTLTGGSNPDNIEIALDNSNVDGVPLACPIPAGDVDESNGSELDNVFATIDGTRLRVFIGGNLQSNNNALDLFLDVGIGGQNRIGENPADQTAVTNPDVHFHALQAPKLAGLKFDDDFFAAYYITVTTDGTNMYGNSCILRPDGQRADGSGFPYDYGCYDGGAKPVSPPHVLFDGPLMEGQDGSRTELYSNYPPRIGGDRCYDASPLDPDPDNPFPIAGLLQIALNNSNVDGVGGYPDGDVCSAAYVTTGIEFEIDLAELGWDGFSPIKLAGWINNGAHDYMSNQVLGGLPVGTGNLATASAVDFSLIDGLQYVVVNTCPSDVNNDGFPSGDDFDAFVAAFESGIDPAADFDRNCFVNGDDFDLFVNFFIAGC